MASLAAGVSPLLSDYLAYHTKMSSSPSVIMVMAGIVLINISVLARRYRSGRNTYSIPPLEFDKPIFTIQYRRPVSS